MHLLRIALTKVTGYIDQNTQMLIYNTLKYTKIQVYYTYRNIIMNFVGKL